MAFHIFSKWIERSRRELPPFLSFRVPEIPVSYFDLGIVLFVIPSNKIKSQYCEMVKYRFMLLYNWPSKVVILFGDV
jgi:hypothetical protein